MKNREDVSFFKNIGICTELPKTQIRAKLYTKPEDFIVEEIGNDGKIYSPQKEEAKLVIDSNKKYIHAILVKKNISTFEASAILTSKNNLKYDDISFHGLKDTNGLTTQKICIKNYKRLKYTSFQKFFLKDFTFSDCKLKINCYKGNRFIITAREISDSKMRCTEILEDFKKSIKSGFPNFYGPQRFGIRQKNHEYGKLLIRRDYEDFIFRFLTDNNNEPERILKIRKKLYTNFGDWKKCLEVVRNYDYFFHENNLLSNLLREDNVRSVENMKLSKFLIRGYSSYLFNLALSFYLEKYHENINIELIGSSTKLDKVNKSLYKHIFRQERINLSDFKFKKENLNIDGHPRPSLFYPKNFNFSFKKNNLILRMGLGEGMYASIILDYLFDNRSPNKYKSE